MLSIRKRFWLTVSTMHRYLSGMARRCGCGLNASLVTNRRNTLCGSKPRGVSMDLAAAGGDFGKTAAMNGTRGFESAGSNRVALIVSRAAKCNHESSQHVMSPGALRHSRGSASDFEALCDDYRLHLRGHSC